MPDCQHCSKNLSSDAKYCPSCGKKNPTDEPQIASGVSPLEAKFLLGAYSTFGGLGALLFGLGGAVGGFEVGGLGGAIIFGLIFAVIGGILGVFHCMVLHIAVYLAIAAIPVAIIVLIFYTLWGVGK